MSDEPAKSVKLRATCKMVYQGRALRVGDEFEASEEDAADLCARAIDTAVRVDDAQPRQRERYRRRDLRSEE